jgi:hypothetical protein
VEQRDFGLWVCHECKKDFLFQSDVDDHMRIEGHREIRKYDLKHLDKPLASGKN